MVYQIQFTVTTENSRSGMNLRYFSEFQSSREWSKNLHFFFFFSGLVSYIINFEVNLSLNNNLLLFVGFNTVFYEFSLIKNPPISWNF